MVRLLSLALLALCGWMMVVGFVVVIRFLIRFMSGG
jgi:hypothetical protein